MLLKISIKNIKSFANKYTSVFVILIIGFVLSSITLIYVTVKLDSKSGDISSADVSLNVISLDNEETKISVNNIKDAIIKYCKNDSMVNYAYCEFSNSTGKSTYSTAAIITDENNYMKNFNNKSQPLTGEMLSEDDLKNGNQVGVIVSQMNDDKCIQVDGHAFKNKGSVIRSEHTPIHFYIPLKSVEKLNLIPNNYCIVYKKNLNLNEIYDTKKELKESFPDFKIKNEMDNYHEDSLFSIDKTDIYMLIMSAVAILSVAYLYTYIIRKRINQIYIFKISGASSFDIYKILFSETMILLLFQDLISIIIFRFVLIPIINKHDIVFAYCWSWYHVAFAFLALFILTVFIFTPIMLFFSTKNAVRIKDYDKG